MRREETIPRPAVADRVELRLGDALRLVRGQRGLTVISAARLEGGPNLRTLRAWENRRKLPTMEALDDYLAALGVGWRHFLEALEEVEGRPNAIKSAQHLPRFRLIDVS